MWHFQTRKALDSGYTTSLIVILAITVLALVAVFAVAKVVLSRDTYVEAAALQRFALAMLIGAVGPVFRGYRSRAGRTCFPTMATIPVVFFLATWAAERQRDAAARASRRGVARGRAGVRSACCRTRRSPPSTAC